jgi:hypothetical protein
MYADFVSYNPRSSSFPFTSDAMYVVNTIKHYEESASSNLDGLLLRAWDAAKEKNGDV